MPTVVKRTRGEEAYDERKVYTSVILACQETGAEADACETIAASVADTVTEHVQDRDEVLSVEIRMWARNALKDAGYETIADTYYRGV